MAPAIECDKQFHPEAAHGGRRKLLFRSPSDLHVCPLPNRVVFFFFFCFFFFSKKSSFGNFPINKSFILSLFCSQSGDLSFVVVVVVVVVVVFKTGFLCVALAVLELTL